MSTRLIKRGFACIIQVLIVLISINQGLAQQLWGIGQSANNDSVYIYRLNIDGSNFQRLRSFPATWTAVGGLVNGNDGFVYGMFNHGGQNDAGFIYRININDTSFSVIKAFNNQFQQYSGNMVCIDSTLYYMCMWPSSAVLSINLQTNQVDTVTTKETILGSLSKGIHNQLLVPAVIESIYEYYPETQQFKGICTLPSMAGYAIGAPFQCQNGDIYTVCKYSGNQEVGAIARYNAEAVQSGITYDFAVNHEEYYPIHSFIETSDHKIMGIGGGAALGGFLFRYGGPEKFKVFHKFDDSSFGTRIDEGELAASNNGKAYGTTTNGGAYGLGSIFSVNKTTYEVLKIADLKGVSGQLPEHAKLTLVYDTIYAVSEPDTLSSLGISPNPCTDYLQINLPAKLHIDRLEIIDLNGTTHIQVSNPILYLVRLNVAQLANGIYILRLWTGPKPFTFKFVKLTN